MDGYPPSTTILLNPEEFAQDEQSRLGRANGNTYQRVPGVPDVHDGQIMVRLKKKRFIILDYGYVPSDHDREIANVVPHVNVPDGAGTAQCATRGCPRVGVPVLMYDSEPNEPMSLYARGGLCFSCQRSLNEKRRTNRKRKLADGHPPGEVSFGGGARGMGDAPSVGSGAGGVNNSGYRFRFNDQIVDLNPDAVVINGPVDGARVRGPDYRCPEIGRDLLRSVQDLSRETVTLLQHTSGARVPVAAPATVDAMYQRAFSSASKATFLLTQWRASRDEGAVAPAPARVASAHFDSQILSEARTALHGDHRAVPDGMGFLGHAPAPAHPALDGGAPQPLLMPGEKGHDHHHEI